MAGNFLMVAARVNELKLERDSTKGEDPDAGQTLLSQGLKRSKSGARVVDPFTRPEDEKHRFSDESQLNPWSYFMESIADSGNGEEPSLTGMWFFRFLQHR